jgi:hypothetical protein
MQQYTRDNIRVEMRDRLGRITAILDEIIGPEPERDYQRLAKRTFLNFQDHRGSPHYSCHVLVGDREISSYSRRHLILET